MHVIIVPVLSDNYAYLVVDRAAGEAAAVDPAEARPILERCRALEVRLVAILTTHYHWDHVGGNAELLAAVPALRVYGPAAESGRVPGITHGLADGDRIHIGNLAAEVFAVPGHTGGHLAYYFPEGKALFTGDTLFAGGCGRLFEGDPGQMLRSLQRLAALPDDTLLYCGHEYTERNLRFAANLEPRNARLAERLRQVEARRRAGQPTVPSTIGEEKETNPFLRPTSEELRATLRARMPGLDDADPVAVFAAARQLKDSY